MNLKGVLGLSTGLMVACAGLISSSAYAEDYVTKSQVNAANGVAGLNSQKEMTANVNNSQVKVVDQYKLSDGSFLQRPLIKFVPDNQSGFTLGKEMVQIGGDYVVNDSSLPIPMGLSLYGRPYGNYNAGCTLCIFSTSGGMSWGNGQAAISGIDYRGGAGAVANGDMATVGFYHYDENSSGRIVSQVSSFGADSVTLSVPMTDKQMSQLHQGMYIATNVVDPNISDDINLLHSNSYRGFIKSWDATHIYVYAWAVLGKGNAVAGQIPNINYLDNQLSSYKVPMVFVGVSDKIFAENEYMVADGSKVIGDKATAIANKYEREEFDFRASNWTKPKSLSFHGWTTSFECRPNCDSKAISEDSYAYLVNGSDGLPRAYVAQTVGDALEYSGYSTFIGGNGAPQNVDANGNISVAIKNSNHIMNSYASNLPSGNIMHMNTIVNRETVRDNDWRDYAVRLVMDVDSQRDRKKGLYNGSRMGSIAFNYNAAHYGGVCLLGYDINQGLCQEGDGSVNFAKSAQFNSTVRFTSPVLLSSALYNSDTSDVYGQGTVLMWNTVKVGSARTEFVNVDPINGNGGFDFYDTNYYNSVKTSTPMFTLSPSGTAFNVRPSFKVGVSLATNQGIFFQNSKNSNAAYLFSDENGDMNLGTQIANGANMRGINGYYGQTASLTDKLSAPNITSDNVTVNNGFIVQGNSVFNGANKFKNVVTNTLEANDHITSTKFIGLLSTPSSSKAACTVGEFKDDVNYHYVCVAANKWKRVALSEF